MTNTEPRVDAFNIEKECEYKGERYSVRDNGAVFRHKRECHRSRKSDETWTFGKPNEKTGYMEIAGVRVHRIVACAFLEEPPTEHHVIDHKDTNRRNNRPENLRWVTRDENMLHNPITRKRIIARFGSIEAFREYLLTHPHKDFTQNYNWMRPVTYEEGQVSLKKLTRWAESPAEPSGGTLGESVFGEANRQSLTANAIQVEWGVLSEFPCCPQETGDAPLRSYQANLKHGCIFCTNAYYTSLVEDFALSEDGSYLLVMSKSADERSVKGWALAKITVRNGYFIHENKGSFFEEKGARKYFTLAQGKEWTGGDCFDDFC